MASMNGWYDTMTTADLRQEAERAEREAEQYQREEKARQEEAREREGLIARIEAAKKRLAW
jgi:hypothetical protein